MWAALGNVMRLLSLPIFLSSGVLAVAVFQLLAEGAPTSLVIVASMLCGLGFVVALLFWFAKGALISGSVIAQLLVGLYMLLWVLSTALLGLLVIGVVYLFTTEPEVYTGLLAERKPEKPRWKPPVDWQPTGRIGPSGAMAYSDAQRGETVWVFESFVPVQVVERLDGIAHVIAATGERGWIDTRTLTEGV
jgi:hypothetical protein